MRFTSKILLLVFLGAVVLFTILFINTPPKDFPTGVDIVIEDGLTVNDATEVLKKHNVVRSSLYLYFILNNKFGDSYIQAGTYRFTEPLHATEVADAVTQGRYLSPLLTVTLPEGFRARDITTYFPKAFSTTTFPEVIEHEGYLFPDTYFISPNTTAEEFIELLQTTFEEKLLQFTEAIAASPFTKEEVIILASIIEREANDEESMHLVSGILQNRLEIGMPLQVDAAFDYLLGKESSELTAEDLELDSPYNTYLYRGLPPTPISNPGLASIRAVLEPTETEFMYYLTADDGTFYYAETFDEHKLNKEKYLQ